MAALRDQGLSVFVSSKDIQKGDVWFGEISSRLSGSTVGILCVTPDALKAPWMLFEAGAPAKQSGPTRVTPLLIGVSTVDLTPPISLLHATHCTKEDMLALLETVNSATG